MSRAKPPAIGIDLGTTNSCVAVWRNGNVHIIANEQGKRTTPSYVTFNDSERLFGDLARNQLTKHPRRTVFNAKRLIGCRYTDPCVLSDITNLPYTVKEESGWPMIEVTFRREPRTFAPEEISAMILQKMKQIAETSIGEVKDAVISVPASFNDVQRKATIDAGTVAGLNVLRIINEPTAAAIAYGFEKNLKGKQNILVYDLGGGSFDVSIVEIKNGCKFECMSTAGDTHLGGIDFDNLLVEHLVDEFQRIWLTDVSGNARAMQRLRSAAEKAKVALSSIPAAKIELDSLIDGIDFNITITRETLETLCSAKFLTTISYVEKVMSDAQMEKSDIHQVLLVGGSTRIPKVKSLLNELFPNIEVNDSINLDESVASGAAIVAARLNGDPSDRIKQIGLSEVSPKYTGIGGRSDVLTTMRKIYDVKGVCPKTVKAKIYEFSADKTRKLEEVGYFECTIPRNTQQIDLWYHINEDNIIEMLSCEVANGDNRTISCTYITGNSSVDRVAQMMDNAAKLRREEEVEKQRADARHQLEKYAYSVITDLEAVESKLRENNWTLMKKRCETTLTGIEKHEDCGISGIQKQLLSLQADHQRYQKHLRELIKVEMERERKRNEKIIREKEHEKQRMLEYKRLEQFVKKEMEEVPEAEIQQSLFQPLINLYNSTLKWLTSNPSASKQSIEECKHTLMQKKADIKAACDRQREKHDDALNLLKGAITFSEKEMNKVVDDSLRCKEWHELKELCRLTQISIDNNMLSTIDQFQIETAVIQSKYNQVTHIIKKEVELRLQQKAASDRQQEEEDRRQLNAAHNALEEIIRNTDKEMNKVDDPLRCKEWQELKELCRSTRMSIHNNVLQTKEEFDTESAVIQSKHTQVADIIKREIELRLQQKAASDRQREEERRQLKVACKTLEDVIRYSEKEMNKVIDGTLRCKEWHELKDLCVLTQLSIYNNKLKTKEEFDINSEAIKSKHSQVSDIINKEIGLRSQLVTKKEEEQNRKQGKVKEELQRDAAKCEKVVGSAHLQDMTEKEHDKATEKSQESQLKAASDRKREEDRRQLNVARKTLEDAITLAEKEMNKVVDCTLRCKEWHELKELCRSTQVSISNNIFKTHEEYDINSEAIKSKHSQVSDIVNKKIGLRSQLVTKQEEEQNRKQGKVKEELQRDPAECAKVDSSANAKDMTEKEHDKAMDQGKAVEENAFMKVLESNDHAQSDSSSATSTAKDPQPSEDKDPGASTSEHHDGPAKNESGEIDEDLISVRNKLSDYIEELTQKDIYTSDSRLSKQLVACCNETWRWICENKDVTKESIDSRLATLEGLERAATSYHNIYRRNNKISFPLN